MKTFCYGRFIVSSYRFPSNLLNHAHSRHGQDMYGIVVETLQFSVIYQTRFDGTSVFVSVIEPEITVEFK